MREFRNNKPQRTYIGKPKTHYKKYIVDLRKDFNGRCAYTDCSDEWWGDGFHVDHFAPKKPKIIDKVKFKKFADREHLYENLIYACPQVNRAKGNDWPSDDPDVCIIADKGYLEPCKVDFNEYFERTNAGGIIPKDHPISNYMWIRLKLYLKRYEIYWRLEQIMERLQKLQAIRKKIALPNHIKNELLVGIADLNEEYMKYLKYLRVNYRKIIR